MSRAYYCTVKELNERGKTISRISLNQYAPDLQLSGNPCLQLSGSRRIRGEESRTCCSRFDHADRGTGLLRAKYITDQFHA